MGRFGWALRSESTKFGSFIDARAVAVVLIVICFGWAIYSSIVGSASVLDHVGGYLPASGFAPLTAIALMVWGALAASSVASEYRFRTIDLTALAIPRRSSVFAAKAVSQAAAGVVAGVALTAIMVLIHLADPAARVSRDDWVAIASMTARVGLVFGITGVLGLAVGFLTRRVDVSWILFLLWPTLVERVLSSLPVVGPVVGPVMPFRNADYFALGESYGIPYAWGPLPAVLVPLCWALLLGTVASWVYIRGNSHRSTERESR